MKIVYKRIQYKNIFNLGFWKFNNNFNIPKSFYK